MTDCPKCRAAMDAEREAIGIAATQEREIERLRGVIAEASTKLKLLYMAAGLGQTTGLAALEALNAEITKLDAVTYDDQQSLAARCPDCGVRMDELHKGDCSWWNTKAC